MKIIEGIRLVLSVALMVLFSGTMASAHTGHEHAPSSSSVRHTTQQQLPSSASIDVACRTSTQFQSGLMLQEGPVVTATDRSFPTGTCASRICCCCNGPSSCGMAGACHALAILAADQPHAVAADRSVVPIAASESILGSILFGLDRPPKA